ncbi:MAG: glutathione S-transferase family protein [Deltaproteobacteria bacterium]|nr:glutathione S-transferase family protein [Deltaproteobacteria bacterium]
MRIYVDESGEAPSPRRVRIFLAEKGLAVPYERLALHEENRTDAFRKKNPYRTLPVLELDDGTCIAESMAICRYFEALHPEPHLFGSTPLEQAEIEMWTRRIELSVYLPIDFAGATNFLSEASAARFREGAGRSLRFYDRQLSEREFMAGVGYSVADVFALSAIDFGLRHVGFALDPAWKNLHRWHTTVSARPSAAA